MLKHVQLNVFKKHSSLLRIHVHAGKNNTILSATRNGNVFYQTSGGQVTRHKSSSDAAAQATLQLIKKLPSEPFHLLLKGFGPGRDVCYRVLRQHNVQLNRISDVTPVQHGGCRPKKKRRL
jgi:small subunit ribosomal protein S11